MMGTGLWHFRHHRALLMALGVGLLVAVAGAFLIRVTTAALVGWDVAVIVYVIDVLVSMRSATIASMKGRAQLLAPGRGTVLAGAVIAAVTALGAIIVKLVASKGTPEAPTSAIVALVTVLLSWGFVHFFFAQHYAHDFWREGRGLAFPGNDTPGYGEFLYFSFTVGMTAQVSDVTTNSQSMRKTVLLHALLAFLFNTAVLASAINLASGLAG